MVKKKILVTGVNGQVGRSIQAALVDHASYEGLFHTRETFDLSNEKQMLSVMQVQQPDAIINAAAYTAVDLAEEDVATAALVNSQACKVLAIHCETNKIPLLHYSSDYVYHNGQDRPLLESDALSPKSVYARTKLDGEALIQQFCSRYFILRTSWVYDAHGQNFVRTMLTLSEKYPALTVVDDQIGSPTYAPDIARASLAVIDKYFGKDLADPIGVYNFSNEGVCSWYDFAKAIFELSEVEVSVNPVPSAAYPRPAARPHYSVLNKSKIRELLGYPIPHWRDSLKTCLKIMDKA